MSWEEKEIETKYDLTPFMMKEGEIDWELEEKQGVMNEVEAAAKISRLYPYFRYCPLSQTLFMYDGTTGMFTSSRSNINLKLLQLSKYIHFMDEKQGVYARSPVNSYATKERSRNSMYSFLESLNIQPDFMRSMVNSSLGYLLFKNGIYDFKTMTFTMGFIRISCFITELRETMKN
ncbi:MAG: hypothetical protein EOO46_18410 [Flavobacterium sp.]|nr:MAG: hypothetical protein EOO46_18410 [Flavobacterium sp.]